MGKRVESLPRKSSLYARNLQRLGVRGLHCGCGLNLQPGWINTDSSRLTDENGVRTIPEQLMSFDDSVWYVEHNAAQPFPFSDDSFDWILAEHFIEYLTLDETIFWLSEMRRLLVYGGWIRISTPDLRKFIDGYLDESNQFFNRQRQKLQSIFRTHFPNRNAWMVNQIFYHWGHKWIYDFDEIRFAAVSAGFQADAVVPYRLWLAQVDQQRFQALLSAADLFLTPNFVGTTLSTAITIGLPMVVVSNSVRAMSVDEAVSKMSRTPSEKLLSWLTAAVPIYPFYCWPIGYYRLVSEMLENNPFCETYRAAELLHEEEVIEACPTLLYDEIARSGMIEAQTKYVETVRLLPRGADLINLHLSKI